MIVKQTKILMITLYAQAAIAVLNDIYTGEGSIPVDGCILTEEERYILLQKLSVAGLIKLSNNGDARQVQSYCPMRKSSEVSLLNILEAIGEHLNCNFPTTEAFYMHYGRAAQKLGVINHLTRVYLDEIKLSDL